MIQFDPHHRAQRLLRLYPRGWRDRYGIEFAELLEADISDRPICPRRWLDVLLASTSVRLSGVGLVSGAMPVRHSSRLALLSVTSICFAVFAIGAWSELAIGWRWEQPNSPLTEAGMFVMTAAVASLIALVASFIAVSLYSTVRSGSKRGLIPVSVLLTSAIGLVWGSAHFSQEWPGSGGHEWAFHSLVPAPLGAFGWSLTRWITTYWLHPAVLSRFGQATVAWMILSPLLCLAFAISLGWMVRSQHVSEAAIRLQQTFASLAVYSGSLFLLGLCGWLASREDTHPLLFHTGKIDIGLAGVLAVIILTGLRARKRGSLEITPV